MDDGEVVAEFVSMMECEASLDRVVECLADVGVVVVPWQRVVVAQWLDSFEGPVAGHLPSLREMLRSSCPAP